MAEKDLTKTKRKNWYPIMAPKMFNEFVLGESLMYNSKDLVGRSISVNLMNIVNDPRKQNTNIQFRITNVQDNKGYTEVVGLQLTVSSIKRLVRRGYIKIEQSVPCLTQDKKPIMVKTLMLISDKCKGSLRSMIRHYTVQYLRKNISKMTYEAFVTSVITGKLQSPLQSQIKKLYPLRICEIRRFHILEGDEAKEVEAMLSEQIREQPPEIKEHAGPVSEQAS